MADADSFNGAIVHMTLDSRLAACPSGTLRQRMTGAGSADRTYAPASTDTMPSATVVA